MVLDHLLERTGPGVGCGEADGQARDGLGVDRVGSSGGGGLHGFLARFGAGGFDLVSVGAVQVAGAGRCGSPDDHAERGGEQALRVGRRGQRRQVGQAHDCPRQTVRPQLENLGWCCNAMRGP